MFFKKITQNQNSEKYGLRSTPTVFRRQFRQVRWEQLEWKQLDQWRAKGSDANPHLKELYKEDSPIFKDTDILNTGCEIKHDITYMSHPYRTKQQIIDMPKWHDKINCVLCNVPIITSKIRISLNVFHSFSMMPVIWHLVLLMSWLYRQCVSLRCDQVCYGGEALLTNCET